jgi:hypothetical protein
MNTKHPTTTNLPTHELMEMASLDAMGLLDPEERDAFERSFRGAAPAVQAQIRREQLRFSSMDGTLPQIEPSLGLRARVIAAVREAMDTVAARRGSDAAPALQFSSGVSRFWRVGAIGAMAAAIVLGISTLWISNETKGLTEVQNSMAVNNALEKEMGRRFSSSFMNASTQFISFVPATDAPDSKSARARLMFDPSKKQAELFVQDLPSTDRDYEVVVIDKDGNTANAVISFKAPVAGFNAKTISNLDMEHAKQIIIRVQGSDKPILKTDGI